LAPQNINYLFVRTRRTPLFGHCHQEIQDADRHVDFVVGGLREFWKSELHCDDELLQKSSEVLIEYKEDRIVAQADRATPKVLRSTLGRALLTLQDFYSHSNWVNRNPGPNHSTPNEKLGKEIITSVGHGAGTWQEIWPARLEGAGDTSRRYRQYDHRASKRPRDQSKVLYNIADVAFKFPV
jgi:hypothetical protein